MFGWCVRGREKRKSFAAKQERKKSVSKKKIMRVIFKKKN